MSQDVFNNMQDEDTSIAGISNTSLDDAKHSLEINFKSFSIKAEGEPAIILSQLAKDEFSKLTDLIKNQNIIDAGKYILPHIKDVLSFCKMNNFSDFSATPTSGKTVSTDAKVSGNDNIPGNGGGTV